MSLLYGRLNPGVVRYCRARLGNEGDDVASEAWIDIARNLPSFEGDEDALRGWVFTIARRRVLDDVRRRKRRPAVATDDVERGVGASPSAEESALTERLGDDAARRIVASLPPEQADVLLLRIVAGLSVEEVAGLVGRKPGHVRVLQHRALKRLAETFDGDL